MAHRIPEPSARALPGLRVERLVLPWNQDGGMVCSWRPEATFLYVQAGEAEVWANARTLTLTAGEGAFINCGCTYTMWAQAPCRAVLVTLAPEAVCGPADGALAQEYAAALLADAAFALCKLEPGSSAGREALDALIHLELLDAQRPAGLALQSKAAACALWAALYLLHFSAPRAARVPGAKGLARLQQGLVYLHEHYAEKITLDTIAEVCDVSKSECCRLFQRFLRQPPFEYLLRYRVHCGVPLLRDGMLGITEIAWITGFSSPSYFSEIFRRYYGCAPTEYRRECATGE